LVTKQDLRMKAGRFLNCYYFVFLSETSLILTLAEIMNHTYEVSLNGVSSPRLLCMC
jgi:hypothetical protein